MKCSKCGRKMIHLHKNEWICPYVSCREEGIFFSTYAEIQQDHTVPTLREIEETVFYKATPRTSKTIRLSNNYTLHQWTTDNFYEIQGIYLYLCGLAKKKYGSEGWRRVSFETVALWTAIYRHNLKKVQK